MTLDLNRRSQIAKRGFHEGGQGVLRRSLGIAKFSCELLDAALGEIGWRIEPVCIDREQFRASASRQSRGVPKCVAREFAEIHRAKNRSETSRSHWSSTQKDAELAES